MELAPLPLGVSFGDIMADDRIICISREQLEAVLLRENSILDPDDAEALADVIEAEAQIDSSTEE